jgi:hypothetical protein
MEMVSLILDARSSKIGRILDPDRTEMWLSFEPERLGARPDWLSFDFDLNSAADFFGVDDRSR